MFWPGYDVKLTLLQWFRSVISGVTDEARGARRPHGKLNVKNGPPSEISWTAERESASTIFGKQLILKFQILK